MGVVEGGLKAVILLDRVVGTHTVGDVRLVEDARQIDALGLPMLGCFLGIKAFDLANHFVDGAEAEFSHDFAEFHGDEGHEVDHMLGLALEILAKLGVLRRDADRAGVLLTDAHHQASDRDERGGGESVFLRTKQRGDGDVATGLELAVRFKDDAAAQVVEKKDLVGFSKAKFPGGTGIEDGGGWGGSRAAVVTGDENHVGVSLRDTRGDRSDADFRHQLHVDAGARVGVFQVVNEFR